jgi:hypothetical protein
MEIYQIIEKLSKKTIEEKIEVLQFLNSDLIPTTKQGYRRLRGKSKMAYKFAKGKWFKFGEHDFITNVDLKK